MYRNSELYMEEGSEDDLDEDDREVMFKQLKRRMSSITPDGGQFHTPISERLMLMLYVW